MNDPVYVFDAEYTNTPDPGCRVCGAPLFLHERPREENRLCPTHLWAELERLRAQQGTGDVEQVASLMRELAVARVDLEEMTARYEQLNESAGRLWEDNSRLRERLLVLERRSTT